MNAGIQGSPLNINLTHNHSVGKIDDVIGYPTKVWRSIRKYSVKNTLPIAAVNTWLQFSLAYAAAIIITSNDLSFITAIFNPTLMSVYALVSVILGAVLLTSLVLKNANKKEIKDENSIDEEIGTYQEDEKYNEIAEEVEKIEIIINFGSKKFSIIVPISKTQRVISEEQQKENRNKIILLTIPYVISAAVIIGALMQNRFSFANVIGWQEWSFIALVSTIAIVGICIAFNKLSNNKMDKTHNFVTNLDAWDILLPWRKAGVSSVMAKRATGQEENGPLTPIIRVLREIGGKLCEIVREGVQGVENNFNDNVNKFLKETKKHIKTLLDNLEKDIKQNVGEVKTTANKEITDCLQEIRESVDELCKEVGEDVKDKLNETDVKKLMDLVSNLDKLAKTVEDRVARLQLFGGGRLGGFPGATFSDTRLPNAHTTGAEAEVQREQVSRNDTQPQSPQNEFLAMLKKSKEEVEELKKVNEELKKSLEELKNKQSQPNEPDSGIGSENGDSTDPLETQVKKQREKVRKLKLEEESSELAEERERLEKKLEELPKQKEWKETLNGPASKLFDSLLKSIKLEIVDTDGAKTKTTLREIGGKMEVHYGNAEQKICPIKGKGSYQIPHGAVIKFLDPKLQAGWEMADGGKSR